MRILFLGDIVGSSGCNALKKNLPDIVNKKKIDFVIVNGENAADDGVGITKKNSDDIFKRVYSNNKRPLLNEGQYKEDLKRLIRFIYKFKPYL